MTEMMLGEDLIKQIEQTHGGCPEDATRSVKFDDKGTLHLMYRDDGGKLLKNTSITNGPEKKQSGVSDDQERVDEINKLKNQSSFLKKFLTFLAIMVITSVILAAYFFYRLR